MTQQEKNIAIAESIGATCKFRHTVIGPELVIFGPKTLFWDKYKVNRPEESISSHTLPDFVNDLNAMNEAEKGLANPLLYIDNLACLLFGLDHPEEDRRDLSQVVSVKASIRADAYLMSIGKL